MQEQKAKPGYKLAKSLFGKYEEIPKEWDLEVLGNLCKIRKENGVNSKLYVGLEHISQGTNLLVSRGTTSQFTSTKNVFKKGDVLYGKLRPLLNKVWLATEDGYCSIDILPLIVKEKLNNKILLKLLTSEDFVLFASSTSAGTKMPRTNWSDIQKYEIRLPPLPEQQKITSILSNVDELIESYDKVIDSTRKLKQGLMQQLLTKGIGHTKFKKVKWLFGKEMEIPEEWNVIHLEDVTRKISDGIHSTPNYVDTSDFYFINGNNLVNGSIIIFDNTKNVSDEEYQKYRIDLNNDTVLLSINGTIGNLAFYNNEGVILGKSVCYIICEKDLDRKFLFYLLQSTYLKKFFSIELTSTTIQNLSLKTIRNSPVLLPNISEQQKIAFILSGVDSKISDLHSKKSSLEKLKKGLMQKLLTGQIRVPIS